MEQVPKEVVCARGAGYERLRTSSLGQACEQVVVWFGLFSPFSPSFKMFYFLLFLSAELAIEAERSDKREVLIFLWNISWLRPTKLIYHHLTFASKFKLSKAKIVHSHP